MKILVTGSAGFIGSRLKEALLKQGHEVFDYDIMTVTDFPDEKVDLVYHLAARVNAFSSVANPLEGLENVETLFKVLEWMRSMDVKNIIFSSSREVYSCTNPYGASKIAGEAFIGAYVRSYGFGAVFPRLANIYGPGNLGHRFIESTIKLAKEDKDILIYGGEDKIMNFLHVDDAVKQLLICKELLQPAEIRTINIAYPTSYSLPVIASMIVTKLNSQSRILPVLNRPGETLEYVPDAIFYSPTVSLEEGIDQCINASQS